MQDFWKTYFTRIEPWLLRFAVAATITALTYGTKVLQDHSDALRTIKANQNNSRQVLNNVGEAVGASTQP